MALSRHARAAPVGYTLGSRKRSAQHRKEGTPRMIQQVLPARVAANLHRFAELRVTQPIRQDPTTGIWHVYRYADVVRVLTTGAYFDGAASAAGAGQFPCA